MKRYVNFKTNINDFKKVFFGFPESITIESMIKTFLKSNNSKIPLGTEHISVIHNSRLINDENYLHKKISTIFKNPSTIYHVNVFTCGDIMASSNGNNCKNKRKKCCMLF